MAEAQTPSDVHVLEKGDIVFFYRPKKGIRHPKTPDELERAYFMLLPEDQRAHKNRLFNVAHGVFPEVQPGKALPEERDWAYVQEVATDPREALDALEKNLAAQPEHAGERVRPWARAAGQGRYVIASHDNHTHLAYKLSEPVHRGEVQRELQIKPEASYVLSVKDPYTPSEIELEDKPNYPESLRKKFDGHGWIAVERTDFLDYQWTQVLLIGAGTNVEKELGIKLRTDVEGKAEKQIQNVLRSDEQQAKKQGVSLLKPLETGRWE